MKNIFKVFTCSIALLSMGLFTSCDNGDVYIYDSSDLSGESPSISISTPAQLDFTKDGGTLTIDVKADSKWSVESDQENWVMLPTKNGNGNGQVTIEIAKYDNGPLRRANVTFIVYQKSTGWKWGKQEFSITQTSSDKPYVKGAVEKLIEFIKSSYTYSATANETTTLNYSEDKVRGVVLANYGDGNINQLLSIGDNMGTPNSAILLYGFNASAATTYPVGSVVEMVGLKNATYNSRYGLRQLQSVTVNKVGESQEVVVPNLTVAELQSNEYQGQYVQVENVHATGDKVGGPWNDANSEFDITIEDAAGSTFTVHMGKSSYSPLFSQYTISSDTGTIKGLCGYYRGTVQLQPVWVSDVLELSNVDLSVSATSVVLDNTEGATAEFKIRAKEGWTISKTGEGFTVSPESGAGNNDIVTVTASAAATEELSKELGTITVTAGAKTAKVTVRQKGKGGTASIRTLNDLVATDATASLKDFGTFKAYVAANNVEGNLENAVALVDNTGKPYTGMIFFGSGSDFEVGSEVEVDLSNASNSPYYGLPEIKDAKLTATGNKATMVVPELTVAEANSMEYVGMYICVKDVAPAKEGTWYSGSDKGVNTTLTDLSNASVSVRVMQSAKFGSEKYIAERGNIYGVMEVYNGSYQMFPTSSADVKAFAEPTDPILKVNPDNLTFIADGETHSVALTTKNIPSYEVTATTDKADQFTVTVSEDKKSVSVTAKKNEKDSAVEATLNITVSYTIDGVAGSLTKTVALKQNAAVSADASRVKFGLAEIESALGRKLSTTYEGTTADPSSWVNWTTDNIGFAAAQVRHSTNADMPNTIQMRGSASNVKYQGFITNTASLTDIQEIVVKLRSFNTEAMNISIYMGYKPASDAAFDNIEVTPTKTSYVQDGEQYIHTVTYSFAGNKYEYFKLVNKTTMVFSAESFEIVYKK